MSTHHTPGDAAGEPGVARSIARIVSSQRPADLPELALDYAAMLIASTLASAAFGTSIKSAAITRRLAARQGGVPQSSLWFDDGAKLPVSLAARANAVTSDAAASDDSDLRNIVHPGTPLVATSLALGEKLGSSGEEVLAAIVLGYEAQYRVGSAVTPGFNTRGFHGSIVAVFGSAAAAARLLDLDEEAATHTIALAATSIGGMMAAANTSVSREYHAGLATMLGVEAALAASEGFTGEERIIEMPRGFIDLHGGGDAARALAGFGETWGILEELAIKVVPGAHQFHALAEAGAEAAIAGDVQPDEVERIIAAWPDATRLPGPIHPRNLVDMAHSAAYFVAAGVADRTFSWQHASMEKITDPVINALCDRVEIGAPPAVDAEKYRQGATVTVVTRDGRSFSATVFAPRGSASRGIGWEDIGSKYRALFPASGLDERRLEQSLEVIRGMRTQADVHGLIALLRR